MKTFLHRRLFTVIMGVVCNVVVAHVDCVSGGDVFDNVLIEKSGLGSSSKIRN